MLPLLLAFAATAGPLDSPAAWTGTWDLTQHRGSLVVQADGRFRLEIEAEARCFVEGTLVAAEGGIQLGTAEERAAHEAAVAAEVAHLDQLQADLDAEEAEVLDKVEGKPGKQEKYVEKGYTFKTWFNAPPEVELPADHEAVVALAAGWEQLRHCNPADETHTRFQLVLGTRPELFFVTSDRAVVALPQPDGSDRLLRFTRGDGAAPATTGSGAIGGAWVARLGARDAPAALWGELRAKGDHFEARWWDGCEEHGTVIHSASGFTFDPDTAPCGHLGTFRRIDDRAGGLYWLRDNGAGPLLILREDGL